MTEPDFYLREESRMRFDRAERVILGQAVRLLVREKLMDPEEQLRFLALLKEEE